MNILQRPEVIRNSVPPEMVDFGSGQGRSLFATTPKRLRDSREAQQRYVKDCKKMRMQA
jgi:hypothetical protein